MTAAYKVGQPIVVKISDSPTEARIVAPALTSSLGGFVGVRESRSQLCRT